jgi:hypothetical protein
MRYTWIHAINEPRNFSMLLLQISVVVFLFTEEFLYTQIDNQKYAQIFAIFLAVSGVLLIFKSLNY